MKCWLIPLAESPWGYSSPVWLLHFQLLLLLCPVPPVLPGSFSSLCCPFFPPKSVVFGRFRQNLLSSLVTLKWSSTRPCFHLPIGKGGLPNRGTRPRQRSRLPELASARRAWPALELSAPRCSPGRWAGASLHWRWGNQG